MIASANTEKVIFLSIALRDGSLEAFADINDAVTHATTLVREDDIERVIFVAVPRARVHRAVRVEPVDPPPMLGTEQQGVPRNTMASGAVSATCAHVHDVRWEGSQEPLSTTDGCEPVVGEHYDADEERDHKPLGVLETDLAALDSKLSRSQRDYERARVRGDEERINRFKLQGNAIATELNRLKEYLSKRQQRPDHRRQGTSE